MARDLMTIEACLAAIRAAPLSPAVADKMRHEARVRSSHYSTRIEGNRLTLYEAERVIAGDKGLIRGKPRDAGEVQNYWKALAKVEAWAEHRSPITEDLIRRLHALVEGRSRSGPSLYRDGQNAVRDATTGGIVYLPPEAKDVPKLMAGLIAWLSKTWKDGVPAPLIAGLLHYQFVTIHPFFDGNGRTARLLATLLLDRCGYGLPDCLSVEEEHHRDLAAYYAALRTHPHHNYYEGRAEADLTPWVAYFASLLARGFTEAKSKTLAAAEGRLPPWPKALGRLDPRARRVLGLFSRKERITASDVAEELGLSPRMARVLLAGWSADGWIRIADPSRKARAYVLSAIYRQFIGNPREAP